MAVWRKSGTHLGSAASLSNQPALPLGTLCGTGRSIPGTTGARSDTLLYPPPRKSTILHRTERTFGDCRTHESCETRPKVWFRVLGVCISLLHCGGLCKRSGRLFHDVSLRQFRQPALRIVHVETRFHGEPQMEAWFGTDTPVRASGDRSFPGLGQGETPSGSEGRVWHIGLHRHICKELKYHWYYQMTLKIFETDDSWSSRADWLVVLMNGTIIEPTPTEE